MRARPGDVGRGEEEAEEIVTIKHETRNRVKEVKGVGMVWEEQDVVVKQTQLVWRVNDDEKLDPGKPEAEHT